MSKAINLGYIMKVSVGSVSGGLTEGDIITAKKVTLPGGRLLPYISGQSLRYMMRRKLEESGWKLADAETRVGGAEKKYAIPPGKPEEYVDEDLLGYLEPEKQRRRTAPVRVSAAVGIFPYRGDRDLGTRSFEKITGEMKGSMFETEVYYDYFRGNILIELDRIGRFEASELGKKKEEGMEECSERGKRLSALLTIFKDFWGGGKQSRLLTDLTPKFLMYARQSRKVPIFLEALTMTPKEEIILAPIFETLRDYESIIEKVIVGIRTGVFVNEGEIRTAFEDFCQEPARLSKWGGIHSITDAIDEIIMDVEQDKTW